MALKKADNDAFEDTHAEAYHKVGKWSFYELYGQPRIQCTVFTYRSQADRDFNMAERAKDEPDKSLMKPVIQQRDFTFTVEDFGGKDKLTMAETYKLLKKSDFFVDAVDA